MQSPTTPDHDQLDAEFAAQLDAELAELSAGKVATVSTTASTIPKPSKAPAPAGFLAVLALADEGLGLVSQVVSQVSQAAVSQAGHPFRSSSTTTTQGEDQEGRQHSQEIACAPHGNPLPASVHIWLARLRGSISSRHRRPFLPSRWRDHNPTQKLHRAGEALTLSHTGIAFTLNLAPPRQETLRRHDDPARLASTYISRELKRAGLDHLGFGFAFDLSDKGKLHLHGMIERPADHELPALKDALRRAGGKVPVSQVARVLQLKLISTGWGWVSYSMKGLQDVARYLGKETAPFISRKLATVAQAHTERVRAVAQARKAGPVPVTVPAPNAAPGVTQQSPAPAKAPAPNTTLASTAVPAKAMRRFTHAVTLTFRRIIARGRNLSIQSLTIAILIARGQSP